MKTHIWNHTTTFPDKVNFIDSNNVILGYDLGQCCCENAFWTISEAKDGSNPIHRGDDQKREEIELEGYCFDPQFCEREGNEDEGGAAIFRLCAPYQKGILPDLFVRLENHHNGYYSHGFTFRGAVIIKDSI